MRFMMAIVLVFAACGSQTAQAPSTTSGVAGSDPEMQCHDERPTGSSIPRRVCRSKAQTEDQRYDAQQLLGGPHPRARTRRR